MTRTRRRFSRAPHEDDPLAQEPELTEAEAREQNPPSGPVTRCVCGEPLHREGGWTLSSADGCPLKRNAA